MRMLNLSVKLGSAFLGFSLVGCAGVSQVASLPPDVGVLARYHSSADAVSDVVPQALASVGQSEAGGSRTNSGPITVLGSRGPGFTTWGEVSRTMVTPLPVGGSEARVVTRPRYQLDFWPATSQSLKVISEIDRLLGASAIALFEGDYVRGVTPDGAPREGVLTTDGAGRLSFGQGGSAAPPVSAAALNELEIRRGSYGRGRAGAAIGATAGILAWVVALGVCFDGVFSASTPSGACDSVLIEWAPLLGGAVGALLGSAVRTSIWSRVDLGNR